VEKCPISIAEKYFNKFLDQDPDGFQNLISSSFLSAYTSAVEFSDPFSGFYIKLLTDRQTYKRRALHNLPGRGNEVN